MSLKNITTITQRKVLQGEGAELSAGQPENAFVDNTASSPRQEAARVSPIARGGSNVDLSGGAIPEGLRLGDVDDIETSYVHQTPSGHIIEYNDTPFNERIMIRHAGGTGINIGPDGSVIISSKTRVDIINGDHQVTVGGDGSMTYKGNLTLKVEGDFNLDVSGDYNVNATNYNHTTYGSEKKTTYSDQTNVVLGNKSEVITGSESQTIKGGSSKFVKGDTIFAVEGLLTMGASGVISFTSEVEIAQSSPDINIAASSLSVFGDTGTIGGENVQMYTQNLRAGGTVYADVSVDTPKGNITRVAGTSSHYTTFHGDLNGLAKEATTAGTSLHQSYADGTYVSSSGTGVSPGSYSVGLGSNPGWTISDETADDLANNTTATVKPTSVLLASYLEKGSKGVRKVVVDPEDVIVNTVDLTTKSGGISNRPLGVDDVRAALRDPANRSNSEFISSQIANGTLSPEYAKTSPPSVARTKSASATNVRGGTPMGNVSPQQLLRRSKGI